MEVVQRNEGGHLDAGAVFLGYERRLEDDTRCKKELQVQKLQIEIDEKLSAIEDYLNGDSPVGRPVNGSAPGSPSNI